MSAKTRVFLVRVVGFSAPERQMLNSIFLLSVAPARQIGYKLWNPETGAAPDMYLLDGDSHSAVASWQATFASTSDRTLVVGSKNTDLGVASAARPLGLKVVGAMDRLAIALGNVSTNSPVKEPAGDDTSAPRAAESLPANTSAPAVSPAASPGAGLNSLSATQAGATVTAAAAAVTNAGTLPTSMTSAAPATTVLPNVTLQPNVSPSFDRTLGERTVTEKTVDRILSDKPDRPMDKTDASLAPTSGATPLSPAALAAAVAPTRRNLRVISLPPNSPLAASMPTAASGAAPGAAAARLADQPLPSAPVVAPPPPVIAPAPPVAATPQVVAPPPPAPVVPVAAPPAYSTTASSSRHDEQVFRVLAVDDSPLMRTFLQNKLQPYGIVPEFAASGEEALFKISKQHFDLIFLDVMLPGMDGYDVCKMIKKNKDNSLMKVVMLTSKDKTFDKIRGTMAGCDGYLTKPVDEMKLRAIIERHTIVRK